jgi:predicted dehydrogenase
VRFGVVGGGWRAEFYLRLARELPARFTVVGQVTRSGLAEMLDRRPDFVVTAVAKEANARIVAELVERGVPVLSETPPAPTVEALRELWSVAGGLVQVAEQYPFQPMHAVRLGLARDGALGQVTGAQVSSTHDYHAVALLRGLLGAGFAPAVVGAGRFAAPIVRGPDRGGRPAVEELVEAHRVVATLDFGAGRLGLYDFTDGQWFHPLRGHRHVVSGTHGEIVDDVVVRLADAGTAVSSRIERRQTGLGADLEGFALDVLTLDGAVRWRNPYFPARLSDEEIAIARCLDAMSAWVGGTGEPPYPLAEACQDQLIALAIAESWRTARPVRTNDEPWGELR